MTKTFPYWGIMMVQVGIIVFMKIMNVISQETFFGFLAGIIGSLTASVIFQLFSQKAQNTFREETKKELSDVLKKMKYLDEVKEHVSFLRGKKSLGIEFIVEKTGCDSNKKFWNSLLEEARDEIELAAHTLGKWLEGYEENYKRCISNLMKNNKPVSAVFLNSEGAAIKRLIDQKGASNHKEKSQKTKKYYDELIGKYPKNSLKMRALMGIDVPYLYINTGKSIYFMPYSQAKDEDLGEIEIIIKIKRESGLGTIIRNDFLRLLNAEETERKDENNAGN